MKNRTIKGIFALMTASMLSTPAFAVDTFDSVSMSGELDVTFGYTSTTKETSSANNTKETFENEGNKAMVGAVTFSGDMWSLKLDMDEDSFTPSLTLEPMKKVDAGYVKGKIQIKNFLTRTGNGLIDDAWIEGGNEQMAIRAGLWERDEIDAGGLDTAKPSSSLVSYDYDGRGLNGDYGKQDQLSFTYNMGDDGNFFRVVVPADDTGKDDMSIAIGSIMPHFSMKNDALSLAVMGESVTKEKNVKPDKGDKDKSKETTAGLYVQMKLLNDALGVGFGQVTQETKNATGDDLSKVVTQRINLYYTADLGGGAEAGGGIETIAAEVGTDDKIKHDDTRIYAAYKQGSWFGVDGASVTYGFGQSTGKQTPPKGDADKDSTMKLTVDFEYAF